MITLSGESGGGQLLRSALTLSCITGQPFHMKGIRSGRPKPGLMRQHLTCVRAAAAISAATVTGAEPGSMELTFTPGAITGGDYRFDIGSGGSTTLVLQTLLPALLMASTASRVTITGGTHNPMAPPADFLEKCYLPVLRTMGVQADIRVEIPGFMAAGGGMLHADIQPLGEWQPLHLMTRGEPLHHGGTVLLAHLEPSIARREIATAAEILGWEQSSIAFQPAPASPGPGSIIMLESAWENITELSSSVAEVGRAAEAVGATAARQMRNYIGNGAPVSIHLADQLLLPMALCGSGIFATFALSKHTRSHMTLIPRFLPIAFHLEEQTGGIVHLSALPGEIQR